MAGAAGRLSAGATGRVAAAVLAAALLVAAGPSAPDPVRDLAGRYSAHFRNGLVDGSEYWSDNVAEVVPLDAGHAYVRFSLQFYNGHSCSLAGVAARDGAALVYREPPGGLDATAPCRLVIERRGDQLAWNDGEGSCKGYCGARGSFLPDGLPWKSRRPITYLARLRASAEYRGAVAAWRAGR